MSTYFFKLQYRAGKQNLDADALSRHSHGAPEDDPISQKERERIQQFMHHHLSDIKASHIIPQDVIQAVCDRHIITIAEGDNAEPPDTGLALVESLAHHPTAIPDSF